VDSGRAGKWLGNPAVRLSLSSIEIDAGDEGAVLSDKLPGEELDDESVNSIG
jgi:hypothetical protein